MRASGCSIRSWASGPWRSQAIKMKRKAVGCELNPEYWRFSVGYAEAAEAELHGADAV
jgi:hypothetical protein